MKLRIVFTTIGILSLHRDFSASVDAKSVKSDVDVESAISFVDENIDDTLKNCSLVSSKSDCFLGEGRIRKKLGNKFVIVKGGVKGHGLGDFYVEQDYNRLQGKKGRKKGKKKLKHLKKMAPLLIGLGGLKMMILLKKMALFSFLSFMLSKISFILASLVALKQFFSTQTHHRSADSNKLEVVHIPIRKYTKKKKEAENDWVYEEESQFIPVTHSPDAVFDTTPYPPFYYNFPRNENEPEAFNFDDENVDESFDGKFRDSDIYNEHFKESLSSSFDRSDDYTEKSYYKNHVRSPFA